MKFETVTLKDLTADGKGHYGIGASAVEPREGLYTYLRITDIRDDGTLNAEGLKCVDDPDANKYLLKPDDIVFARTGASTGRNYFYDARDGEFVYAGFLIKFSLDPQKVNPKYIKYYCQSDLYKNWIASHSTGSTRGNINAQAFGNMPITLPSRQQQDFLVDLLAQVDDKIRLNNKINDNLEQQAEAIYNSMFVDFDSLNQNEAQNSELGLIPIGWNIKSLSEVTQNIRDRVKDNVYNVLSALNTGCLCPSEEYFTKQVFSKNIKNYIVVQEFDFAYNPSRINIGSIGMNNLGYTGCVSPVYVVIRPEKGYYYFLDFFIKSKRFKEEVKVRASGSVRQSLTYADFGQIKVVYPPLDVVSDFNNKYEQILRAIRHYKKEIDILQNIRDTLLPKLMSGEIDVEDVKI